jgi:DNA-directed RNA polymerase subunit M/transcription elongation factor TFIIS
MDITFACESCGQSLVIDKAAMGQLVDCPKCGKSLEVPYKSKTFVEAATSPASAPPLETEQCPFCAKLIKPGAYVCKHCGRDLPQLMTRQVCDPVDGLDTKQRTQQMSLKELGKTDMDIAFDCHECGQRLVINKAGANTIVDCPKCGTALVVPGERIH